MAASGDGRYFLYNLKNHDAVSSWTCCTGDGDGRNSNKKTVYVSKDGLNPATQNNKNFRSLLNFLGTVMLGRKCSERRQK